MRVWADIYDANDNRLGDGPVFSIRQAQVKRALDGGGSLRATLVATDPRALALGQVGRLVRLWGDNPDETTRLLGEGVISTLRITDDPSGAAMVIDGPDLLEELKWKNALLGRIYNQQTLATVAQGLIDLVPRWAVRVDASIANGLVDARFDGINVLKAFQQIAKQYGYHIRASSTESRTLEIGPFGEDSGLRVFKVETTQRINPDVLMVQRIQKDTIFESNDYFNVLMPIGAGEGVAALTLAQSTRTSPYPIQTMTGPDGSTLYYVSTTNYPTEAYTDFRTDPAAVVKVGQYKELAPLSNSEADLRNASNALYDMAVIDLERGSTIREDYRVTVKNAYTSIQPGSRVHLNYLAQVMQDGVPVPYLTVRGDYYVLRATEQSNLDGTDVQLEISNIDEFVKDEVELLFDAVDSMELRSLKPNVYGGKSGYVYARELAPGFPAQVPIDITDATTELYRARLRVVTSPFRATVSAAVAAASTGGGVTSDAGGGSTPTSSVVGLSTGLMIPLGMDHRHDIVGHSHTVTIASHTHEVPVDSHTHTVNLTYGIQDDTEYPEGITVWFQGTNVTNLLFGGPLAFSGGAIDELADAGALANLLNNASGGLRQLHVIEFQCGTGQGRIEVTVELFETTQSIRLGS